MLPLSVDVPALIALALFFHGWLRLRRRGRTDLADWRARGALRRRPAVVLAGLLSPIHTIGGNEDWLWVHMLQHVLIGDLGIALMVVAVRGPLLVFLLPSRRAGPVARDRRRSRSAFVSPPAEGCVHALGRKPRDLAHPVALRRRDPPPSGYADIEHACWMLAGLLVWTLLVDPGSHRRLTTGGRIALAAAMFGAGQVLTSVLIFSFHPLYALYHGAYGFSALTDQKLAGVVMMVEQLVVLGTFTYLVLRPRLHPRFAHA